MIAGVLIMTPKGLVLPIVVHCFNVSALSYVGHTMEIRLKFADPGELNATSTKQWDHVYAGVFLGYLSEARRN